MFIQAYLSLKRSYISKLILKHNEWFDHVADVHYQITAFLPFVSKPYGHNTVKIDAQVILIWLDKQTELHKELILSFLFNLSPTHAPNICFGETFSFACYVSQILWLPVEAIRNVNLDKVWGCKTKKAFHHSTSDCRLIRLLWRMHRNVKLSWTWPWILTQNKCWDMKCSTRILF